MDSDINYDSYYTDSKIGYNYFSSYESFAVTDYKTAMFTDNPFSNTSTTSEESLEFFPNETESFPNDTISQWWQQFSSQYLHHNLVVTAILALAYFVILIAGIIGNSLVILSFIFCSKMQTVTNFFIMNLAVADLLTVFICFLGNLLSNTIIPWVLGSFMCKAVGYVQGMSVCASAYMLAAVSIDRCKAIYRPQHQPQGLRRRQAAYAIIVIWVLALCLPLPWAITLTVVQEKEMPFCRENWPNNLFGQIYFFCVSIFSFYMLPSIFIIVSNVMIWYRISRRQVPQAMAEATAVRQMHSQARSGVRKMLGIVTIVFLLSWMPLYSLVIRYKYYTIGKTEKWVMHILLPIAQYLGSLNSAINPILYAFLNEKFRVAFKSLLPNCNKVNLRAPSSPPAFV